METIMKLVYTPNAGTDYQWLDLEVNASFNSLYNAAKCREYAQQMIEAQFSILNNNWKKLRIKKDNCSI